MQKMAKNGTKKGLCGTKSSFYSSGSLVQIGHNRNADCEVHNRDVVFS